MIGFLQGTIFTVNNDTIILLINGVGYTVYLPWRTLQILQVGQNISLYIYTHVREDQLKLFGFENEKEKNLFLNLLNVSGVGPKTALSILSQHKPDEIEQAISKADVAFFTKIKGIGKKAGQKIIIDLKNKIGSLRELNLNNESQAFSEDIISALMTFGFLRRDIIPVLKEMDQGLSEDQMIKLALQRLGKVK